MWMNNKWKMLILSAFMLISFALPALAADSTAAASVKSDVQIVGELGLLQGDGSGLTEAYLAKTTTRLQAAILYLRLKGLETTALAFSSSDNFTDVKLISSANQNILAYLKANPALGWTGTGNGAFEPMALITAAQYYKVLLEAAGYKQGTDFEFANVLTYAKSMGLSKVANMGSLRNRNIATALVEGSKLKVKGMDTSIIDVLISLKMVDSDKAAGIKAARLDLATSATLGTYLVDEKGNTLYYFTKDTPNVSNCMDTCATNWPIYYSASLQIPAELNAADFGTIDRADGKKQTTYKGMPLYYWAKDTKPGDTTGQGVGNVWYVINHDSIATAKNDTYGEILVDAKGNTLYMYTKDTTKDVSVCKGTCETNWPIFYAGDIQVSGNLKTADFATITREDGTKQTSFKGMPLYYWVKDTKPGDTTGQGVGKVWYVLNPTGANMK
jgi:predicted lipoprotein with Yx(FWY)xxD motif